MSGRTPVTDTQDLQDLSECTDKQLIALFWWSDCLDDDEYTALEVELEKRGINGWTGEKEKK
jgi:hypothetical protein